MPRIKAVKGNVAERIRMLRKELGLSQERLAEIAGVAKNTVYMWEKGMFVPSRRALDNIQQKLGIRPEWLLTGEGPMRVEGEEPRRVERPAGAVDVKYIPIIEGFVGAGGAGYIQQRRIVGYIAVPRLESVTWVEPFAIVVGPGQDSMMPTICPGDYVVVSNQVERLEFGRVYILRDPSDPDGLTLKRVFAADDGYRLVSDNERYKPIYVDRETFRQLVMGLVVGVFRKNP